MYARFSLHTADPARLDEVVTHYKEDVREVFTHEPGYRGMSVLVNDDLGVALVEAYWATEKEMRSNDVSFADPVHDAAFFGATAAIEHYEVATFVHASAAHPGAAVNLSRLDTEPTSPDDVRAAYAAIDLAPLAGSDGLCSAVRFVDLQSGKGVVEIIWRDDAALVAARGVTAARRLEAAAAKTATVRGVERYRLDFHSVELE